MQRISKKMLKKKKSYIVPFVGFTLIILFGAILLALPISNNVPIDFEDALFVSISATSCTGLSTVVPAEQFNFIGQLVIAILMEIGALGFIVFISYIWTKMNKKLQMSDIIMINDNISGDDDYSAIKEYSIFIFHIIMKIQLLGIILLSVKFVPEYGIMKGIWYSIFHTISAFANAGFDLIGSQSMQKYNNDLYLQVVLIILMMLGSIGIFAISDFKKNKFRNFYRLKLQTKIILIYTLILLIVPTIFIRIFEPNITLTNSLFMSAASRSTGLSVINVSEMSSASKLLLTVLMFVGGSPSSTAGGVRVVAIAVILSTMISTLRGRSYTIIFWKKVPDSIVRKAFTIFIMFMIISIIAIISFSYFNKEAEIVNIGLECVSAVTNTGFAAVNPMTATLATDIIIMILMYIGRIGPIAMVTIFVNNEPVDKLLDYPTENVIL